MSLHSNQTPATRAIAKDLRNTLREVDWGDPLTRQPSVREGDVPYCSVKIARSKQTGLPQIRHLAITIQEVPFVRPDATRGSRPDVDRVGAASPHGECQAMRRRSLTWVWWALLLLAPNAGAQASPAVISRGTDAGGFSAFPDICRAKDGELLFAFYSGSGHVTTPSAKWPKCGRIMAIRSGDEGKTWSKPVVIVDTPHDDRDPSLSCLMRASRVRFRPTGRNGRAVLDTPDRSRFPGAGRPVSGARTD